MLTIEQLESQRPVDLADVDKRRIERGALLLDSHLPGWYAEINLIDLDLRRDCGCILGQLFDHYSLGLDSLALNAIDSENNGFFVACNDPITYLAYSRKFDAEWRYQILKRIFAEGSQ